MIPDLILILQIGLLGSYNQLAQCFLPALSRCTVQVPENKGSEAWISNYLRSSGSENIGYTYIRKWAWRLNINLLQKVSKHGMRKIEYLRAQRGAPSVRLGKYWQVWFRKTRRRHTFHIATVTIFGVTATVMLQICLGLTCFSSCQEL